MPSRPNRRLDFGEGEEEDDGEEEELPASPSPPPKTDIKIEDLLSKSDVELALNWNLSLATVAQLRQDAIRDNMRTPVASLYDLKRQASSGASSTGLPSLDSLLSRLYPHASSSSVLSPGQILHISGDAGSGKTQLCLQLASNYCSASSQQSVLFIDTHNTLSLRRVMDVFHQSIGGEAQLHRLSIARALQLDALLRELDRILQQQQARPGLVILDSLNILLLLVQSSSSSSSAGASTRRLDSARVRGLVGLVTGLVRRIAASGSAVIVVASSSASAGSVNWLDYLGHRRLHLEQQQQQQTTGVAGVITVQGRPTALLSAATVASIALRITDRGVEEEEEG